MPSVAPGVGGGKAGEAGTVAQERPRKKPQESFPPGFLSDASVHHSVLASHHHPTFGPAADLSLLSEKGQCQLSVSIR